MRPSRLLTTSAALSLIMIGSTSVALAATASPCGADGSAGSSSCTYTTVGSGTFTVPAGVHSADFIVEGAQAAAGGLGSETGARLNVSPGDTLLINVGGSSSTAGDSSVSTASGTQVLAAAGGDAQDTGTVAAKSYRSVPDVHAGNGKVTIAWAPPTAQLPAPPAPPIPPAPPVPPVPPAINIPGLSINLGALLSGVTGLVTGLLG